MRDTSVVVERVATWFASACSISPAVVRGGVAAVVRGGSPLKNLSAFAYPADLPPHYQMRAGAAAAAVQQPNHAP